MAYQRKNVCVIGAGSSGLVVMKELKDEGHNVVSYEKYDSIGGVFYNDKSNRKAGVYDSTLLTISNYMMAFSSFPPKESERRFWTGIEYEKYLSDFVKTFDLERHIHFGSEVLNVKLEEAGKYKVSVKNLLNEELVEQEFDAIAVCSGTHRVPNYIEIKGQENFAGEIYHSAFYKNAEIFRGKKVLCVGLGETGADIAHEIACVSDKCVLSVRHLQPVVERFPFGKPHPNDTYTSNCLYSPPIKAQNAFNNIMFKLIRRFVEDETAKAVADWNIKAGDYFNHFFTKNEVFFKSVVNGTLGVNSSGIDYLERDAVVFKDGNKIKIDAIMLNTGYKDEFPFLEGIQIPDIRQLYKHSIHPDLGPNVTFIGWARPAVGGIPACSEMQARYFALLCSNKLQLPNQERLLKLIARHALYENEVYFRNPNVRTLVHYNRYMNDYASIIGCSPWSLSTFLDPILTYRLWFGSQMPVIYRLKGPHCMPDTARKVIKIVPVGFHFVESVLFSLFALISRILAMFRIIPPDPKY